MFEILEHLQYLISPDKQKCEHKIVNIFLSISLNNGSACSLRCLWSTHNICLSLELRNLNDFQNSIPHSFIYMSVIWIPSYK